MSKEKKRYCKLASLCYSTFYCLFIGFIMTVSYASLKNKSEMIMQTMQDWESNYALVDLQIITANTSAGPSHQKCPPNFEVVLYDVWEGTERGCNCVNVTTQGVRYKDDIFKGACTYNEIIERCKDVLPLESVQQTIFEGKVLCGRRLKTQFFNYLRPINGTCEEGLHICGGVNQTDSNFCFDDDMPCPINDIQFYESSTKVPEDWEEKGEFLGEHMAFSRSSGHLPVVSLQLS